MAALVAAAIMEIHASSHPISRSDAAIPAHTSSSNTNSNRTHTIGYHNTFSTHAPLHPESAPPRYTPQSTRSRCDTSRDGFEPLPSYSCDVAFEGFLDMKLEYSTPFLAPQYTKWSSVYVVLYGTQLHIYRVKKSLFRSKPARQGRLIRSYSLQHAEVGIAIDWLKGELTPRASFVKVLTKQAQLKLYESDPELFEPVREWVFRLRIEGEQYIFSADSHAEMLDWVEEICVGIDVSPPLEDRNEPRYKSLPRRSRRQRAIEQAAQRGEREGDEEERLRRQVAEQEELFRRLYPNLAAAPPPTEQEQTAPLQQVDTRDAAPDANDNAEFDREDALGEPLSTTQSSQQISLGEEDIEEPYDPKTNPGNHPSMTVSSLCRFRRRCAPLLVYDSARASNIIFQNNERWQIDYKRLQLVKFEQRPPRYDNVLKESGSATHAATVAALSEAEKARVAKERPILERGTSEASVGSQWSYNSTASEDLVLEEDIIIEEEEESEQENARQRASSLRSTSSISNHDDANLDRIVTVASDEANVGCVELEKHAVGVHQDKKDVKGKGKGAAILVSVRKISAPSSLSGRKGATTMLVDEDAETVMAIAKSTPLLV